jgi:hypothetical protein
MDKEIPTDGNVHSVHRTNRGRNVVVVVVRWCRKPLLAYMIVTLALMVGAAAYQHHANEELKRNDYNSCLRAQIFA